MIYKLSKVQDPEANKAKSALDVMAAKIMSLDIDAVREAAGDIYDALVDRLGNGPHEGTLNMQRIIVAGGAGSGKTTIAAALSKSIGVKSFDFDEYIPGGWTEDKKEYDRRFNKALYELWEDVPQKKGFIVEHVEACNPDLVGLYRPDIAILVDPGLERLRQVAEARTEASSAADPKNRLTRALQSDGRAKTQFKALPGEVIYKANGFTVKDLRPDS